jgi:myosin heavy subunit
MGILLLLDEETNLQKGSDEVFVSKVVKAHAGTNAAFKAN